MRSIPFLLAIYTFPAHALDRELQSGLCDQIQSLLVGFDFGCDCNFELMKGTVELACSRSNVCGPEGNVCADVGVDVGLDITKGGQVTSKLCLNSLAINLGPGFEVNDLCIDYKLNVLDEVINQSCPDGLVKCISSSGRSNPFPVATTSVSACNVSANGSKCKKCKPCDNKGGVTFDCTNVINGLKVNQCARFRPSLGFGSKASSKIPKLDIAGKI